MLIGIENIISWAKSNDIAYWQIKSGSGEKSHLMSSATRNDGDPIALEDSINRLRQELERLGNGNYFISGWQTMGQTKGRLGIPFQITAAQFNSPAAAPQVAGIGSLTLDDIEKRITDALEKERAKVKAETLEKELAELKKENKELKSEADSAINRIVDRVGDVMGYMDIAPKKQPGQNNTPAPNISGTDTEAEGERIGALLEQWAAQDPNFAQTLQGIVSLSKNDPARYSMGKKFLT